MRATDTVLDVGSGFGEFLNHVRCARRYWDFWDHRVPISERSLTELLETRGFRVADAEPRFLPYTTRSSLPQSPWLVRLYLAFPLAWRLLGGQFLIRAEKR